MHRRQFLRHVLAANLATATLSYGNLLRIVEAAATKTLVVIFQRGGCDGLNTVVPYGESEYYQLRGSIAIPPPSSSNPRKAIDLNGFFGLHPSLALLHEIYQNNHLAVLPTVHFPGATRSHFVNQDDIESGADQRLPDGWLNRHLTTHPQTGSIRGISFGSQVAHALRGLANVAVINDLQNIGLKAGQYEGTLRGYMQEIYGQSVEPTDSNRWLVYKQGNILLDNLTILGAIDPSTYVPANSAVYPTSGYGKQLRQIAQLIKANIGLETVSLNIGGWDHHQSQGGAEIDGRQSRLHEQFAQGIHALYTDLGGLMKDVVILTMTEFGRTAAVNASNGTDHGHASAWFVVGRQVKGGIYGTWPGLSPNQLYDGRFLNHTIDYRNILGEILTKHLGNTNLAEVLPGYSDYQPLGLLPS